MTNVADEPQHRFTMDPAGQIAAMKSMRENNESLFAIYHSHPQGPAQPSATDMAQASYPEALYLIISLQGEAATKLRGFYLQPDSFAAVDLHIS